MIVHNFHVVRISLPPFEADAPLVADADTVLARLIAGEFLQAIRRGNAKVLKRRSPIQHPQFPQGNLLNILG